MPSVRTHTFPSICAPVSLHSFSTCICMRCEELNYIRMFVAHYPSSYSPHVDVDLTSPLPLQVYQEVFKVSVDAFDLYIGFASEIKCPAPTRYQFWLKGKSEDQTKCVLASCNHIHCPHHPIYCMGYSTSFHNWTISCRTIMHITCEGH